QTFQLVLQPCPITRQLVFRAGQSTPTPLFRVGNVAQPQIIAEQPANTAFRISKVGLAPTWTSVRPCLCQPKLKLSLQCQPPWLQMLVTCFTPTSFRGLSPQPGG